MFDSSKAPEDSGGAIGKGPQSAIYEPPEENEFKFLPLS
jgi:hypothetical protein